MKKILLLVSIMILTIININAQENTLTLSNINNIPNKITNIVVSATEKAIEITFDNSVENRELVIYRSSKPINNYNDLINASLIATFFSSTNKYIDYPQPGIPYFYIIMDSFLTKSGKYVINPGQNVSTNSILIQAVDSTNNMQKRETLRNQPLPYLDLKSSIESGKLLLDSYSELPVKYSLTFESSKIVDTILNTIYKEDEFELYPIILEEDLIESVNSEEYQLKRILESDFNDKNWVIANKLLSNFLSVDHSENITKKAHFYLAQVYFFQNSYTKSFLEFTLIQNQMPKETKPWMDKLLTYMKNN